MKIVRIEDFTKTKCRIIFENFESIVLYKRDLKRYSLSEGLVLENRQLQMLMEEILPYRAKARCMKLLQTKDYTEFEIRKKLKDDGYPQAIIQIAVEYLYGYHYLDDERFVRMYYHCNKTKKSRKQIILDLQQKGISKNIVEDIIKGELSESDESDDIVCIRRLLLKRKYNAADTSFEEKEKIKAYLFRKGFDINDINACMRNFNREKL